MKTSHHFLTVNQAQIIWTALRVLILLFTFTAHTYTVGNSIAQDVRSDPEALRGEYVQYSTHGFPTVVVGDVQSMVPLAYTNYLDSHPAIAFFHQQNKNKQLSLVLEPPATSGQAGGSNRILLANRHFNDFLIDLEIAASPEPEPCPTISSRTSGIVTLNNRDKGIFVIKEEGDYEIWCRNIIDPKGHKNKKFLRKLKEVGVKVEDYKPMTMDYGLDGKSFVFTGELKAMSRDEAKDKVRALGGDTSGSVSKKTSYVVAGENPGSKYAQAQKLGVKIITESEFSKMIK